MQNVKSFREIQTTNAAQSALKNQLVLLEKDGCNFDIATELVGSERHYWVSDADEPCEKSDAEAVLAVHEASGRTLNVKFL